MILPDVISFTAADERAEIELRAAASLPYFQGHFPGFPVLPGVVQLGWALAFAEQAFGMRFEVTGVRRLKFMRLIFPDSPVVLTLLRGDGSVEFEYRNGDGSFSSGILQVG